MRRMKHLMKNKQSWVIRKKIRMIQNHWW
jgi:hypothetical protein